MKKKIFFLVTNKKTFKYNYTFFQEVKKLSNLFLENL